MLQKKQNSAYSDFVENMLRFISNEISIEYNSNICGFR